MLLSCSAFEFELYGTIYMYLHFYILLFFNYTIQPYIYKYIQRLSFTFVTAPVWQLRHRLVKYVCFLWCILLTVPVNLGLRLLFLF